LNEEVLDGIETGGGNEPVNTAALLQTAYQGLRNFQVQEQMHTLNEMSTDALVGPTRGGDWDDNGTWRQFHTLTWTPDNVEIRNAWNSLLASVYDCNTIIEKSKDPSEIVQARFLRAFYYYNVLDLYGQTPHREAGNSTNK